MDSDLLLARVEDTFNSAYLTEKPKYLGFLSPEEAILVKKYLDNRKVNYSFYGGFSEALRVFLCCSPEWAGEPVFPITAITFTFRPIDQLRHRDFLGSVLALGLKREAVGDILCENGRAVIFVSDDIADYVMENLNKVGRVGVTSKIGYVDPLPQIDQPIERSVTVASMRLDCVVSACVGCSRNTACEFIEEGLVSVNSVPSQKTTKILMEGDAFSVRRKGKFQIISSDKKTKKDRIVLQYKSY